MIKNIEEINRKIFEKEADTYQIEFYEKTIGARYIDMLEKKTIYKLIKKYKIKNISTILEIGAGGGRWTAFFNNIFPNSKITTTDFSTNMLVNLRNKFQKNKNIKVEYLNMNKLENIDFYDCIFSFRAIKYSTNIEKVVENIIKHTNIKGFIIIEIPYNNIFFKKFFKKFLSGKIKDYLSRTTNIKELNKFIKKNNFKKHYISNIPSTMYKNTNNSIILNLLILADKLLIKRIFARSIILVKENIKTYN